MQYKVTPIDWALLMSLVVVWGSSFAMSKVALRHVSPEWIAASRLCVGGAILSIIAIAQRSKPPATARDIFNYSWLGLIGDAAPFIVITWGMQYISSGVAGLLMGTIPLIVILMAHFTLPGEQLTRPRIAGFIVGFIGIVVLMGPENLLNIKTHGKELLGEMAVLGGCLLYGVNSVSTKRLNMKGTVAVAACVLMAGAVMATFAAWLQSPFDLLQKPASALWAILGLGLFPTGLATVIWFKAVERTSPTFISMSNYLVPVYALVFGALTLGETIYLNVVFALALVLCGILLSRINMEARTT